MAGLDIYLVIHSARYFGKASAAQQLCEPKEGMVTLDGFNEA